MSRYLEFPAVDKFDRLSYKKASAILYGSLVPFCEKKGIFLSTYGNHNAPSSLSPVKAYHRSRDNLFHVKDVQRAFHYVEKIFIPSEHYHNSYDLKRRLEVHPTYTKGKAKRYVTNGDTIAALLLKGLRAQYVCNGVRSVNLSFKIKIKIKKGKTLKYTNLAPTHYIRTPKYFGNTRAAVIHFFQRKCVKCHRVEEVDHLMLNQKKRGKHIIVYKCDKCGLVWYYSAENLPIDSTKSFQIIILCDFK